MGLIVTLIFIPDPEKIEVRTWLVDGMMHWNYYLMGPLLAFRHGAALGTQCYSQYGVGWPLVLSILGRVLPVSYPLIFETVTIWGCLYFMLLYFFLRSLTGRSDWAFVGLLLALVLLNVLRNRHAAMGFSVVDNYAKPGRCAFVLGLPEACAHEKSELRNTDRVARRAGRIVWDRYGNLFDGRGTSFPYCAFVLWIPTSWSDASDACFRGAMNTVWRFAAQLRPAWAVPAVARSCRLISGVAIGNLSLVYSGGFFAALPGEKRIERPEGFYLLRLMAILTTYSFATAVAVFRFITRRLEATDIVMAMVAAFGLGTLVLFINRSHPFNLYHPIIPFCILAVFYVADWPVWKCGLNFRNLSNRHGPSTETYRPRSQDR